MDEYVEAFTLTPTLEVKKFLRHLNASLKETLIGLSLNQPTISETPETKLEPFPLHESGIRLQPLTEHHIDDYVRILESADEDFNTKSTEVQRVNEQRVTEQLRLSVHRRLTLPIVHQFLVMNQSEVVGTVAALVNGTNELNESTGDPSLSIFDLNILSEFRRKGFGHQAIKHLVKLANENGLTPMVFAVDKVVGFYEKLGFEKETSIYRWSNSI